MLTAKELLLVLEKHGIKFFTGVPDSGLKDFFLYLNSQGDRVFHVRAANEGQAIGIATGHYLATGKLPLVYLQNAGLGNIVNPLTSLADKTVYEVPMLLFISWRGDPDKKDEPQHAKMGEITLKLLDLLGVPYEVAQGQLDLFEEQVKRLQAKSLGEKMPVALVFKRGMFAEEHELAEPAGLKREEVLGILLEKIGNSPVISTTGKTSRELYELREMRGEGHAKDLLVIGSMGCVSSIGLAVALQKKEMVYVFDGDGSVLMHMGALPTIGHYSPKNFCHVLLDNQTHESTGGQPTVSSTMEWKSIFLASGYKNAHIVQTREDLNALDISHMEGPAAIIVKIAPGSRKNLSRPSATSPAERKEEFMEFLGSRK
ncbi:MAG: phosphonopyruvate decarboxylase [Candidatus Wildermuthbacteria bacterium]|nr:phosphonopyruvate decarboxylase [Candidatus Wildermuthbacteria bacterium]